MKKNISDVRPAGYAHLIEKFQLNVMPHWCTSSVSTVSTHTSRLQNGFVENIYPRSYWPGESIGDHLEFALKYDGVNLGCLWSIFNAVLVSATALKSETDLKTELRTEIDMEIGILRYIQSKPTGKYARRIWFFFEFLTGKKLPVADLSKGNYTEALEPERYYTVVPGERVQRQRIINNLLGDQGFCPIIRRTEKLQKMDSTDLRKRCDDIVACYPSALLRRALSYLYNKETKSSFEIEHIKPDTSRTERFIGLLELAEHQDFCEKNLLIDLQNRIVDPRFKNIDYRTSQNYVGQTVSFQKEIIHYVSPKPDELPELMNGLLSSHKKIKKGNVSAVVHAAVVAYGFVFLHPFEDGNGRIHRFLIHNILSVQGMVPKGLMFPVSAVMLKNSAAYDSSLEAFSRSLMKLVKYSVDDIGQMIVHNDTNCWYRYMDMTKQTEALYEFISQTVENELLEELNFLVNYGNTKKAIQEIIDMPDRLIDLFIQLCLQNNGTLSARKRSAHFDFLIDDELVLMEKAVKNGYRR